LNDFVSALVIPAAGKLGLEIVFNPREPSPSDRMPRDVLDELQNYTRVGNKTGRNSHPNDLALWVHFVVSAYEARAQIDHAFIAEWFCRSGWTCDDAQLLARSFDESWATLREFDRRRRLP
jgi:hypothetical protein